jgi:hypothetical protein
VTRDDAGANLSSLKPGLLVGLQWKGWTVLEMAHHAVLVQNADDFAVEENGGREGFM